jgi:hypothetical protein
MNLVATYRQTMVIAGLLQGAAMLALHEWFQANGFQPSDLVWVAPAYAVAVIAPLTFNFLRSEFSVSQSARGAAIVTGAIALTAGWFGWASVAAGVQVQRFGPEIGGMFVFGAASIVVWFVSLPFLQAGVRSNSLVFPYAGLFDDAWRNTLLMANCIVFTALFWVLLALWAGLFLVLQMGFFKDLFTSSFFIYLATAVAISFAVSLEGKEASALSALRRHLLAFQTRLLPLAALIVILFLGALPISGLDPVWRTGHATPLMLSLQIVIIALTNAVWQDGEQSAPFSAPVQWLVRAALALLPVLSALCIWSLSLRIGQYGWSIDRVWAAVLVGLTSLYAFGYAASALVRGWLPLLGAVNTWMAMLVIGVLLAVHTPLLDPSRISANSQVGRLVSGVADVHKFDFNYLRFNLGRPGDDALRALAEYSDHPKADVIREKAKEALARTNRYARNAQPLPSKEEVVVRLKVYPADAQIPDSFVDHLHDRLSRPKGDYSLGALKTGKPVPVLSIDLGGDPAQELVLMAAPYPVFAYVGGKWQQIGQISFASPVPKPEEIQRLLENGEISTVTRPWADLRLGSTPGNLTLRADQKPDQ